MHDKLLSIIIPAFNEKNTIEKILEKIEQVKFPCAKEIIAVDDCSTDGTFEKIKGLKHKYADLKVYRNDRNSGKGTTVREGFKYAQGDVAIIQDADLEYDPNDIPKVIQPILEGYADVVYGSRFAGHPRRALYFWHSLGNRFLTFLSNLFSNLNLTDMETGYKALKKLVYKNIRLTSRSFTIEPEITAKVARMRQRIYEVPISYRGRSYYEGKKIDWKDGIKAVVAIIKHSLFTSISDDTGFKTLELLSTTESYNRCIYDEIRDFIGDRVLEVGSGIGNMTKYFLPKDLVIATDISESYLNILQNVFEGSPNVKVSRLDLERFNTEEIKKKSVDTIVCLNVLEHTENHEKVLEQLSEAIQSKGRLILLVPACPWAYGTLDKNLEHKRRYTKRGLSELASKNGFKTLSIKYFNLPGIFGWAFSSKVLRRKNLSKIQMKLFNLLIPMVKLERIIPPPLGLSLIAILEKE